MSHLRRLALHPVFCILAWSVLVHIPGITSPLLDYHAYRQCQTASMARNYMRHGMHFLNPEVDNFGPPARAGTEFPVYSYLVALLYKMFGLHEILGRLLSVGFAAWGAVYLFLFVRQRLGEPIALGAALIMCVIPVHLYFTRTVQPESMALWGFLAFLFHGDRALREARLWNACLTVLFGALPCLLKLSFIYPIAGMWVLLIWDHYGVRGLRFFRGYTMALGMLALTAAWYHYAKSAPNQVLPLHSKDHWENLKPFFTWHLWRVHLISRFPEIYATYPGVLLGGIGAWALRRTHKLSFFAGWFLITLGYEGLLGAYGLQHKYTALPFAPIMGVLASVGAFTLWRNRTQWRCPAWTVGVLLVGIPVHTVFRIAHWYTLERLWLYEARGKLAELSHPEDLLFTNTPELPVILYYLDHYGYADAVETKTPSQIDAVLQQNVRFFVTPKEPRWANYPEWHAYIEERSVCVVDRPDYAIYELKPTGKP